LGGNAGWEKMTLNTQAKANRISNKTRSEMRVQTHILAGATVLAIAVVAALAAAALPLQLV